jgi:hypothetical protein
LEPDLDWRDHTVSSYQGGLDREREAREKREEERAARVRKELAAAKGGGGQDEEEEEGEGGVDDSVLEEEEEEEEEEEWNVVHEDDGGDEFAWARQAFVWAKREKVREGGRSLQRKVTLTPFSLPARRC